MDTMFVVWVLGPNASDEPYIREGNTEWLADFVKGLLEEEPYTKIVINPTASIEDELWAIHSRRMRALRKSGQNN